MTQHDRPFPPPPPRRFFADLIAFGASELASKATRLLVVVVISRHLSVAEVGVAAAALSLGEMIKALTENGIGQRVMAAPEDERARICAAAHRLFWIVCMGLMCGQIGLGAVLWSMDQPLLAALLICLALEYAFMPAGLVQAALAMREGRLRPVAGISGGQVVAANLITVVLVLAWPSPFALILPRLLTAPLWLMAMRHLRPWRRDPAVPRAPVGPFLRFGLPITGIELVRAARLHADKMLVGALLGPEALGLYFMAFNAGLSLATSFTTALNIVLFPHLAQDARADGAARAPYRILAGVTLSITPIVALQSLLAPYYVPLLLGPGWAASAPVVSVLCLTAIPLAAWSVAAARLRLQGRPEVEFAVTLVLTLALILGTVWTAPMGLMAMALSYAGLTALVLGIATPLALRTPQIARFQEV